MRVLILLLLPIFATSQIYRSSEVDNILVNQYHNELMRLAKIADVDRPVGYSKSVTIKKNECYETTIIFYQDKDGEMHDRIVRARLLSYGDVGKIDMKDTIHSREISVDSLTFVAKKVTKQSNGYTVVGNVKDGGVEIPIVLNTQKKEQTKQDTLILSYNTTGNTFNANGRAVGVIFQCKEDKSFMLVKLLDYTKIANFYGRITDDCYSETFVVTSIWWNCQRNGMSWQAQLDFMRKFF